MAIPFLMSGSPTIDVLRLYSLYRILIGKERYQYITHYVPGSPSTREERKSATYGRSDSKRQESVEQRKMYTASSESELFECAILPIFHKLLTERHKSQPHGLNLSYGVSCPNISIKCDIVEYL